MNNISNRIKEEEIKKSIDFILDHFKHQPKLFPRKIMTANYSGQFTVYTKEEMFEAYRQAEFKNCRINAYPVDIYENNELIQPPDFIFIDLDQKLFSNYKNPRKVLDIVKDDTLAKISSTYSIEHSQSAQCAQYSKLSNSSESKNKVFSTVIWSGNGYHIYLPLDSLVLDKYPHFSKSQFPFLFPFYKQNTPEYSTSEMLLQFTEELFTNGRADPQHMPVYKTCFLRIPNTFNLKCLENGKNLEDSKVMLVQSWNGYRPPIQLLTKGFRRWLIQKELDLQHTVRFQPQIQSYNTETSAYRPIQWIDDLLKRGISDGRKESIRLILGPYLAKRKSHGEAFRTLQEWLEKCQKVRPLDRTFDPKRRITSALKNSKGFIKLENLKIKYRWLYNAIAVEY
ncbi:hypothetical protein NMY3_00379 [Candidatus Nitrosocosmicus oleophilus]|uniref:Uncharacterized protein n=1 Tax=Candidatus Nitrosocosmicus oleophilus TaxID=1353260 RepID=A0A654LW89_9ARCH|nr:hypothetical protein [Candidatus Nitrosocosmicus oleophilus]ALI34593.1 hypothetical protein NMY3_00379 [Candidatus Nitrosocosmicus oleophilus]